MANYTGGAGDAQKADYYAKKREKDHQEIELRKKRLQEGLAIGSIANKFKSHYDSVENKLKSDTVGLVTVEEMKQKQEQVIQDHEAQMAATRNQAKLAWIRKKEQNQLLKQKATQKNKLSFDVDEEFDEDDEPLEKKPKENFEKKNKRLGKNPDVDTSFLPDRDRDEEEKQIRLQLMKEWEEEQNGIKNEEITVVYSYWDGSGHRRECKVKKGNTIEQFLYKCLDNLRKDFTDLRAASIENVMYIKEDLIIPHYYTFYDFMVTKARGKSGPLFDFSAHGDLRIVQDASIDREESHAGKVCTRQWYERNKHIFPSNRWEVYDPEKKWDR